MRTLRSILVAGLCVTGSAAASAADIKVLCAGAMKAVVVALAPAFATATGHTLTIDNGTTGALQKRIADGEAFDVAIITPAVIAAFAKSGTIVAPSQVTVAKVGVGVAVKDGATKPDIGTVDAFKAALLAAKSVAYIDPKAGGSSGIYFDGLIDTLGIADAVRAKAKLKQGGYVGELVASGEAEMAVHQISELLPVKGIALVGPLPAAIQNYTVYAAGAGTASKDAAAAQALLVFLKSDAAKAVLTAKGMEAP